jgi:LacI family transcriptional regulator
MNGLLSLRNSETPVSKDIEPIRATLGRLLATGKPVVALVSDLDAAARPAYVGIDDRAAGQLAGFLLGRCLERVPRAEVAVIVGCASYRCHEDREMRFRTLLRQRFPQIELVEAIKGHTESRIADPQDAPGLDRTWVG